MKKLLITASALTMIATQANAEPTWPNWYVGVGGGLTFLSDSDVSGAGAVNNIDYKGGWQGNVSLGYMPPFSGQFLSGFRLEAEAGLHRNSLDGTNTGGTSTGDISIYSYMGNLYYDFRNSSQWTPYIGAGAGDAHVSISKRSGLGNTSSGDNVFAYQGMVGVAYAPTSLPMTEWSIGYRYFGTQDPSFRSAAGKVKLDNLQQQNAEVGARFRF